jgi:hypothetical protein
MTFKTQVKSNLLISPDHQLANYATSLTQTKSALLLPVSSNNGIGFWYTSASNVDGSGDAKTDTYVAYNEGTALADVAPAGAGKTAYDAAFNTNYSISSPAVGFGNVGYGYLDYDFYLKGQNTNANPQQLKVTKVSVKYNGKTLGANDKSWRVAIIAHSANAGAAYTTAWAPADVVTILSRDDAANFTANSAVSDASHVSTLSYGDSKTAYNQAGVIASVASNATVYYKVTARLWLEGEDQTCTNETYAALNSNYSLDLAFELDTATSAAAEISSWGTISVSQAKEAGDAVNVTTVDGNTEAKTLNPFKTSTGEVVYCEDATATASSVFYSVSGTAATTLGTQANLW